MFNYYYLRATALVAILVTMCSVTHITPAFASGPLEAGRFYGAEAIEPFDGIVYLTANIRQYRVQPDGDGLDQVRVDWCHTYAWLYQASCFTSYGMAADIRTEIYNYAVKSLCAFGEHNDAADLVILTGNLFTYPFGGTETVRCRV